MSKRTVRKVLLALCAGTIIAAAQPVPDNPPEPGGVLVFTAQARDYIFGAGGTLAQLAAEGRPIYVVHFGNGEKTAPGMKPSESRLAHEREAKAAAAELGVRETLFLGHKSGEMSFLSSSELRNQAITLMRFYKPESVFFPDWYIHYLRDDDVYRVGRMAEEAPYGAGNYFLQEMTYMGLLGSGARYYYFYSPYRPYRAREGGEIRALFVGNDVVKGFPKKLAAAALLESSNQRELDVALERLGAASEAPNLVTRLRQDGPAGMARAFLQQLAETIGARHGVTLAEEFNRLGGGGGLPDYVREHAR